MKRLTSSILALAITTVLAGVSGAQATTFTFTPFDVPDSVFTEAFDINNSGQMVGVSSNATTGESSFFYNGGGFLNFIVPGKFDSEARGLNNQGQMVGFYQNNLGGAAHGWFYNGLGFTTLDVIGLGLDTFAQGINDSGQIVGFTQPISFIGAAHAFLFDGATISTFDVPGATSTQALGINNLGQIVGNFFDGGQTLGFIKTGNTFTLFDAGDFVPGALFTQISAINDLGHVVGQFTDGAHIGHGFFYDGVTFTTLDVPGAIQTIANGINDLDMIVGTFSDASTLHGFLAVDPPAVPLPPSFFLLGSGLVGLGAWRFRLQKS
jgi:probable HAF family extracellular repeat protein